MSLFCPGVSWGRRRKALTRGASQRRRRRTPSDAGSVEAGMICGCGGTRKEDKVHRRSPCDDGGGVYMGTENNNNKPLSGSSRTHVDTSIVYFDDSLQAEQDAASSNPHDPGTPYERTPEPKSTRKPSSTSLSQSPGLNRSAKPKRVFIPPWIRNRRYLPSIDDVDFDQIDDISLHSYRSSPDQIKALVRDSPHLAMSPIYENLVDKKLSDVYLTAQMNGLMYSSTPVAVNVVNVAPPQVMTAMSQATHGGRENRLGSIIPEPISSNPRPPKPRTPLGQLSFNASFDQPERTRKHVVKTKKHGTLNESIYDNVPKDDAKENNSLPFQRAPASVKNPRRRSCVPGQNIQNDLRRKALTRNLSYPPIREQDIDGVFRHKTTPGPLIGLGTEPEVMSSVSIPSQISEQSELASPTSLSAKSTLPSHDLLREFDRLRVSHTSYYNSVSSLSDDEDSSPSPSTTNTSTEARSGEYIIHKPRFADNSARQARVVSISPSPESDTSSTSTLTSSDSNNVFPATASFMGTSKIGNLRSFASSGSVKHVQHAKPPLHRAATNRQAKFATNILYAESRLAKQHKNKIRNLGGKPIQVDEIGVSWGEVTSDDVMIQSSYEMQSSSNQRKPLIQGNNCNSLPRKTNIKRSIRRQRKGPIDRYQTLVETYVVIKDHIASEIDECNVHVGDIVFVNSKQQRDEQIDWMWIMVSGTNNIGYIPAFSARPVDFQFSSV